MAGSNWIPNYGKNSTWVIGNEKHLLNKHYEFTSTKILAGNLSCVGYCKPSERSIIYKYEIKYTPKQKPRVYVIHPIIKYHKDIHMYPQDNSLCLYYPRDFSWNTDSHLYNTIVPWTHEWFVFYELYQITGKWLHPAVDHAGTKIKQ